MLASVTVFLLDMIHAEYHMASQFHEHVLISCCVPGAYLVLFNLIIAITININLYIIFASR